MPPDKKEGEDKALQQLLEEVLRELSKRQRKVLGRYISWRERASFHTGLRIGITTGLYPEKEPVLKE